MGDGDSLNTATLVIRRRSDPWADRLRNYTVFLDGAVAGKVSRGNDLRIRVPPGEHALRICIDWCSSKKIAFSIAAGESKTFECGSAMTGWKILLALFYVIVWFNRYITLEPIEAS